MMLQQTIVNRQAVEVLRQRVEKQWQRQSSSPKKIKAAAKRTKKKCPTSPSQLVLSPLKRGITMREGLTVVEAILALFVTALVVLTIASGLKSTRFEMTTKTDQQLGWHYFF
ncbi:hypothetical protein [Secundilactobacillus kimchicus]|uniref:hypothetical protein n=1 Tax=Secundilactobacillus kimchicus TaxID=528209 RepID=UPI0006E1FB72|nr:hypothetical protein [Secundilactobacillus kimchicus]